MFEEIKLVILEQLDVEEDEISLNTKIIDELGADSLDLLEIVDTIEEKFGVKIPKEKAEKIITVGDLIKAIEDK